MKFLIENQDHLVLKDRYIKRRKTFLKHCEGLTLIWGLKENPEQLLCWDTSPRKWVQPPLMCHLLGINQLDTHLVFNPFSEEKQVLFLPRFNEKNAFWEGERLSFYNTSQAATLAKSCFVDAIYPSDRLSNYMINALKEAPIKQLHVQSYSPLDSQKKKIHEDHFDQQNKKLKLDLEEKACMPTFLSIQNLEWAQRLPFDELDIKLMTEIQNKTKHAFIKTIKSLKSCPNENHVQAILNGELQQSSPLGSSFPSIIAGGKNAKVLHYHDNNQMLQQGNLLLLDFGLRQGDLVSDISRTIPVSGKFSILQSILYQVVLDTQKYVESLVKAGVLLTELNHACWQHLNQHLFRASREHGFSFSLPYKEAPHQVSHLIKTQVHDGDTWRDYAKRPLRAFECISNEPGLYGDFEFHGETFEMGIRIEDNLLVSADGCVNLSTEIPKEICEIEALFHN